MAPDIVKPAPVIAAALIVTGAVPVDVRVRDWVDASLITTLPKATLVALMLNVGVPELNSTANVSVTPPALAVSVTACEVLNDETVAVNPTLVALAGTVTVAGTAITELLLDKLTLNPPLPAAALNATVQASVPAPVIDPLVQVSALNTGAAAAPVPLKLITADGLVEELLVMANCPVAAPAVVGSNCTFRVTP
ncbi:MAG: hypothetical protein WAM85_11740 [Terracidiphilus sp.]